MKQSLDSKVFNRPSLLIAVTMVLIMSLLILRASNHAFCRGRINAIAVSILESPAIDQQNTKR
jgi:hypothetical protein